MDETWKHLIVKPEGETCWVTINRPQDRNSLNSELMAELIRLLEKLEQGTTRAVVFNGAGDTYFIGGADGIEMMQCSGEETGHFSTRIQGPNLMQGYWNRPEATEEAFRGGRFHTGDLARMDVQGDIYIVDRKKDMFISCGENVYPAEVENAIYELPQVSEAAVIGMKDEKWGEVGMAVVVVKEGQELTREEVIAHLKGRLAKYKIPKSIVFTDNLPRNAAGKVLKNVLRKAHS